MIKIFANLGTNEKAVVPVPREYVHEAMIKLNQQFGGDWVLVDKIQPGEILLFNDTMTYRGFDQRLDRYSDNIKKLD